MIQKQRAQHRFETPIKMPRGTHYGNNYWLFYSRKLGRTVTAFSNLEYENLITLEMDPEVSFYTEQPLEAAVLVGSKKQKTVFDCWVEYRNGREELQEVKYLEELQSCSAAGERSRKQVELQQNWCLQSNLAYHLRTDEEIEAGKYYIRNLSFLAARVRRFQPLPEENERVLCIYLKEMSGKKIGFLESSGRFESYRTIDCLAYLFYRGLIDFPEIMDKVISNETEVVYRGN